MQRISLVQRARNGAHLLWQRCGVATCTQQRGKQHHTAVPEPDSCMLWTLTISGRFMLHSACNSHVQRHCDGKALSKMHGFALLTDFDSRGEQEAEAEVQVTCRHHWLCGSTPAGCTRSQTPQLGCSAAGGGRQQQSAEAGGALPKCCHSISPRPHSCKTPL